jgi:hypothetical protein
MLARVTLTKLICDQCQEVETPLAPTAAKAEETAKSLGWKCHPGRGSVKPRQVCPWCFADMLRRCGDDRVARARLAYTGKSGETCAELAALWGVNIQTVINWVDRGHEGHPNMQGVPKKRKARRRGRRQE